MRYIALFVRVHANTPKAKKKLKKSKNTFLRQSMTDHIVKRSTSYLTRSSQISLGHNCPNDQYCGALFLTEA